MSIKETYSELDKILLNTMKPSDGIKRLIKEGKLNKEPFNMIKDLSNIEQSKKYHPEGNVLNHVLLVIDEASKNKQYSKDKKTFMWAALLHDIGKLTTTRIRKSRITSYNHDIEGESLAIKFLNSLTDDEDFKKNVSQLVKFHMQPLFFNKNLPFFKPDEMIKNTDYKEVALLSFCDRLGRGGITNLDIENEKEKINKFKEYCEQVEN